MNSTPYPMATAVEVRQLEEGVFYVNVTGPQGGQHDVYLTREQAADLIGALAHLLVKQP